MNLFHFRLLLAVVAIIWIGWKMRPWRDAEPGKIRPRKDVEFQKRAWRWWQQQQRIQDSSRNRR